MIVQELWERPAVMLDLETASTAPNAAILQIGAITGTGAEYKSGVSLRSALDAGLHKDWNTYGWWQGQDTALRLEVWGSERPIKEVLEEFVEWVPRGATIWGNGSMFDCTILESALKATGVKAPWSFRDYMCFRTFTALHAKKWAQYKATVQPTKKHDALEDARYQMDFLRKELLWLIR